ncbi:MAG: polymerase subunit gamma/tau [Candidatus Dependentiae bacterium]|nr:polymerase subunit gamma/tau [Candidatus Dependentiae bacterium]
MSAHKSYTAPHIQLTAKVTMSHQLNLARKWRPRNFDEVVGQDVSISMLRNSLYKNHFFPLYLFAGQKGCGKTSTARILATAANCEMLLAFQQAPASNSLPCLACNPCKRMQEASHPDFIEIDAASHTGVDDIRSLLESCTFMPLMGRRKIYLIDEAHMLSKAAFNAFLKVLEEPPAHTLFMLATTEILKIPDTVRSRSFQLHFSAIQNTTLTEHLQAICATEKISYQPEALSLIIHETDGSARDALNLLEQVRFAHSTVTAETVRTVLGVISAGRMAELFGLMVEKKTAELLTELNDISKTNLNAARMWHLFLQVVRTLIWYAYNVTPAQDNIVLPSDLATRIIATAHREYLHRILSHLWNQEELFLATPYKQVFLEKLFLDICAGLPEVPARLTETTKPITAPAAKPTTPTLAPAPKTTEAPVAKPAAPQPTAPVHQPTAPVHQPTPQPSAAGWPAVCKGISAIGDPILASIFNQATVVSADAATGVVTLSVPHTSPFFIEKINETIQYWRPLLQAQFGGCSHIKLISGAAGTPTPRQPQTVAPQPQQRPEPRPAPEQGSRPQVVPSLNHAAAAALTSEAKTAARTAPQPQRFSGNDGSGKPPWQKTNKPQGPKELLVKGTPLLLKDDNKEQWPYTELVCTIFPGKLEIVPTPESN